jgi:hypothetical protein
MRAGIWRKKNFKGREDWILTLRWIFGRWVVSMIGGLN